LPSGGLGEAPAFQIWGPNGSGGFTLIEERQAPPAGSVNRWWALAEVLRDCRAVLVSALGETPREILTESGIMPLEVEGFIDMALNAVYQGGATDLFKARRGGLGKSCSGKGGASGCM
jgi:nitrogen fixation protein NifB